MTKFSGRISRTTARLAAAVIITGGLAAIPATVTTANAVEPDGPHYQEPTVGQCRNYTSSAGAADSNGSPVIACSTSHVARTIAVLQLPSWLEWSTASYDQVSLAMAKGCQPALVQALGRTEIVRKMSAYSYVWFIPNAAQRDHGARWIRCDVIRRGGRDLLPILKDSAPMLPSAPLPNSVAKCLVGERFLATACSRTHQYRATKGFTLTNSSYPGEQRLFEIAKNRCPKLVSTPRNWYASWPGKIGWRLGERVMVCYSHRSN